MIKQAGICAQQVTKYLWLMWLNVTQQTIWLAILIKVKFVIILDQIIKLGAISTSQNHRFVLLMTEVIATSLQQDGIWL